MNRKIRSLLFQIHMWIGLVLGILLAVLGLSGSMLVYDDFFASLSNPVPRAVAQGTPLSLDDIVAAARPGAGPAGRHGVIAVMPGDAGEATDVRFGQMSRMGDMGAPRENGHRDGQRQRENGAGEGRRPPATDVYVDPVSGKVLAMRKAGLPGYLTFAHQLHGNFLMGRDGRNFVGWLGIAMLLLGVSGLVLWWPRRGQWKYAFILRRTAKGLRFHRELHGMLGIWAFIVFMIVSFSGVVLAWPAVFGGANSPGARAGVDVEPTDAAPIGADQAVKLALAAVPDSTLRSVTLPARETQAIMVTLLAHGNINASVAVDPYQAKVVTVRDPSASAIAWQRPVHQGMLNPVWKFLVFLSGLLPAIFVFTGIAMWWKKRKARMSMTQPLETAQ